MPNNGHRQRLLAKMDELLPLYRDPSSGEYLLAAAIERALAEDARDQPDEHEAFLNYAPNHILRYWFNQHNQQEKYSVIKLYGHDELTRIMGGEDSSVPTIDGKPPRAIMELKYWVKDEKNKPTLKKIGDMTGPQRRYKQGQYAREMRSKRKLRDMFDLINERADETRERRGLPDSATLYEIFEYENGSANGGAGGG